MGFLLGRSTARSALFTAVCLSAALLGLVASASANAADSSCSIGVDNRSILVAAMFSAVDKSALPATVTVTAPIEARCAATTLLPGTYRWRLTVKNSQLTMLEGTTSPATLAKLQQTFALSTTTLEVNRALNGDPSSYQASATSTAAIAGLSAQVSAGTYQVTQLVDVQRQSCSGLLSFIICANDGKKQRFTAQYRLLVTDQVVIQPAPPPPSPPPVAPPPYPPPATGHGVIPSPATIPGYARKIRCEL